MLSIIRSPRELVEEVILVDDASEHEHLGQDLEDYVKTLSIPGIIEVSLYVFLLPLFLYPSFSLSLSFSIPLFLYPSLSLSFSFYLPVFLSDFFCQDLEVYVKTLSITANLFLSLSRSFFFRSQFLSFIVIIYV